MPTVDDITSSPQLRLLRRSMIGLIGALPLLACRTFAAATPRPAMWVAQKGCATAHLFGQMPMRSSTHWLTQEVEAAFQQSDVLWLENPEYNKSSPEVMRAVTDLTQRTAVDAGYSIFKVLDRDSAARLDKVLADEGLSRESLAGRGPRDIRQWLSAVADKRTGVDYQAIPEAGFRKRANDTGKEVRTEWRDLLEVITWSTTAPPELQLDIVRMALDDISRAGEYESELSSWIGGALSVQARMAETISRRYPQLYRRMSLERNAKLADRIAQQLDEGGAQFVCIGILHLVGPGSVQEQLRRSGVSVVRT
jgi:uncharacterized protein YbaP (TraB family)